MWQQGWALIHSSASILSTQNTVVHAATRMLNNCQSCSGCHRTWSSMVLTCC